MDRNPQATTRAGRGCVLGWTLVILAATLFPYRPAADPLHPSVWTRFDLHPWGPPGDLLDNLLMFVPWAFCLARLFARRYGRVRTVLQVAGLAAVLSVTVELVQMRLPARNPSLADVLANLVGAAAGAWAALLLGNRFRSELPRPRTRRGWWVLGIGAAAAYVTLIVAMFAFSARRASFVNWDPGFSLNLGNEATGNRPWRGRLERTAVWDSVLGPEAIGALLRGADPGAVAEAEPIWALPDHPGGDSSLAWRPGPPEPGGEPGVLLGPSHWLTTGGPARALAEDLKRTGRFTLVLTAATTAVDQGGPARLFSLSADPYHRDLTVGQQGDTLIVRLRTPHTGPNGIRPELRVPGVLADTVPRTVVLTYDGATLAAYVGAGRKPVRLDFAYAGFFTGLGFRYDGGHLYGYSLLFWGLILAPPVFLIETLLRVRRRA